MTGYGKAEALVAGRVMTIEVKTLNSKTLDFNFKIPGYLRDREWEIRALLATTLERGKVDLYVSEESGPEETGYSINRGLAARYYRELAELAEELGLPAGQDTFTQVLRMPDVIRSGREELTGGDWEAIRQALAAAATQAAQFRLNEGAALAADITSRVLGILSLLAETGPFEQRRIVQVREKLLRELSALSPDLPGSGPDANRLEQELIYYLEKLDITEEKVRLEKHCRYFLETMQEKASQGKKLGFIVQEMGREINTIGSKASDADIQKLVVRMKDELEKIREQLGNIL